MDSEMTTFGQAWIDGSRDRTELQEQCSEIFAAVFQELTRKARQGCGPLERCMEQVRSVHPEDQFPRRQADYGLFEAMRPFPERPQSMGTEHGSAVPRPEDAVDNLPLRLRRLGGYWIDIGLPLEGEGGRAPSRLLTYRLELKLSKPTSEDQQPTAAKLVLVDEEGGEDPFPFSLPVIWADFEPPQADEKAIDVISRLREAAREPRGMVRLIERKLDACRKNIPGCDHRWSMLGLNWLQITNGSTNRMELEKVIGKLSRVIKALLESETFMVPSDPSLRRRRDDTLGNAGSGGSRGRTGQPPAQKIGGLRVLPLLGG